MHRLPLPAGLVATGFGFGVLEAYSFGLQPLLPFGVFLPPTQPLSGVMFLLAGVSLLGLYGSLPWFRAAGSAAVILLATVVLAEYLLGLDLGLDRLLFPTAVQQLGGPVPGRPDPVIASTFLCLASALFQAGPRRLRRPPGWVTAPAIAAVILPAVVIAGHLFGFSELYGFTASAGTAVHAALVLLLLALGVVAATQETVVTSLLRGGDSGTLLLRRLLPLALLVPLIFALATIWGIRLGGYHMAIGLAIYVVALIGLCLTLAFWAAGLLRRSEADVRASEQARADLELRERLLEAEMAAGAALRDSERRTRELLEILSHAPVLARAMDGRIRFWSSGAERLYGFSSPEAVGIVVQELLGTKLPVLAREAEAELLHRGEWQGEITRRAKSGGRVRVASHWILHRDDHGRPEAVIEVDKDVTGQQRAEERLRDGEARYRALVAASSQIVWTASPDGGRAGDPGQWEAFTGQGPRDISGTGWLEAVHAEDRPETVRAWAEALRLRQPLLTRHRLRRHDGEFRHMEVRAVPVRDESGRIREWVGAHTDITDQVAAEEQLRQAQKLQAVGTLAGGVAHEVNNQLMAVLGFGEFALKELGPDHPQTLDLREMVRAASRAAEVAQQLLTFSRRQARQIQVVDLHAAATALLPVLQRILGADKSVALVPATTQRLVVADPTQVDQVLINLTANARDALSSGGKVTIAVEDLALDEAFVRAHGGADLEAGPYVRITVADNGSGMDPATLTKIFEPFFTTKPVGKGTGLGLSTVYGIVKQHEGLIWASSEPGAGTTFHVYFPAASEDDLADAVRPVESGIPDVQAEVIGVRVLVVEDEPAVRVLARRSLEAAGMTVAEAENGQQALLLLSRGDEMPQLVLTDVVMPGLTGRQLAEMLSRTHPRLPVLFMSAYAEDEMASGLLPEAAAYIQKPFAPDTLVAEVRAALNGGTH